MGKTVVFVTESARRERQLTQALSEECTIRVLLSFDELFDTLKYLKPDVLIIDEKTERFDCFDVTTKVRAYSNNEKLPILILSDSLKKSHHKLLIHAGATAVLREPIEKEQIDEALEKVSAKGSTKGKVRSLAQHIPGIQTTTKRSLCDRLIIDKRVEDVLKTAAKEHERLSLLLVAIDGYQKLKQAMPKKVLIPLERHLTKVLRPQDVLTRLDFERLVIILPKTSETAAICIAENIQDFVNANPFEVDGVQISVTIAVTNIDEVSEQNPLESLSTLVEDASKLVKNTSKTGTIQTEMKKG